MYQTGLPGITISANPLAIPRPARAPGPPWRLSRTLPVSAAGPRLLLHPSHTAGGSTHTCSRDRAENSPRFQAALELSRRAASSKASPRTKPASNQRQGARCAAGATLHAGR